MCVQSSFASAVVSASPRGLALVVSCFARHLLLLCVSLIYHRATSPELRKHNDIVINKFEPRQYLKVRRCVVVVRVLTCHVCRSPTRR